MKIKDSKHKFHAKNVSSSNIKQITSSHNKLQSYIDTVAQQKWKMEMKFLPELKDCQGKAD